MLVKIKQFFLQLEKKMFTYNIFDMNDVLYDKTTKDIVVIQRRFFFYILNDK